MELSAAQQSRREEDAGAAIKLRSAARQAEELKAELADAKSEAVEKAHQLLKCRDEVPKKCGLQKKEYLLHEILRRSASWEEGLLRCLYQSMRLSRTLTLKVLPVPLDEVMPTTLIRDVYVYGVDSYFGRILEIRTVAPKYRHLVRRPTVRGQRCLVTSKPASEVRPWSLNKNGRESGAKLVRR